MFVSGISVRYCRFTTTDFDCLITFRNSDLIFNIFLACSKKRAVCKSGKYRMMRTDDIARACGPAWLRFSERRSITVFSRRCAAPGCGHRWRQRRDHHDPQTLGRRRCAPGDHDRIARDRRRFPHAGSTGRRSSRRGGAWTPAPPSINGLEVRGAHGPIAAAARPDARERMAGERCRRAGARGRHRRQVASHRSRARRSTGRRSDRRRHPRARRTPGARRKRCRADPDSRRRRQRRAVRRWPARLPFIVRAFRGCRRNSRRPPT